MNSRYKAVERLSSILVNARTDAGKSQDYIAKKLGVSKKTIQNWESGDGSPSLDKTIDFFKGLDLPPLPYFLRLLYGEFERIEPADTDARIEKALIERVKACTPAEKRKLLFILYGDHGSSSHGIIEMITAHLHTPLKNRLNIAQEIILGYEIAEAQGELVKAEHVLPDIDYLVKSFECAKDSVIQHKNSYVTTDKEETDVN